MKNVTKAILGLGILYFCLQYSLTFDTSDISENSFDVVLEVKHVQDNAAARLSNNLDSTPDSYQLMYREAEVFAQSAEQEKYLVSKDSILRGLKTDIDRTYVGNTKGIWNLHIVFKKNFSEKLANLSVEDLNQKFAVVINADLMAAPISKDDFLAHRTDEGQLELIIPTNVRQKRFAEKILARYNM